MDIINIKTFLAVTNVLNFTHAAKELGYAQSTVSAQIKQLEEELGYPLFERNGKNIILTSVGSQFVPIATDILHLYNKSRTLDEDTILDMCCSLRIGILESLLLPFATKIMPAFNHKYKNINLQIIVSNPAELTALLNQGLLDIAYISTSSDADAGFRCFYTRSEELVFVASSENSSVRDEALSLEEILRHSIITTEENGICYTNFQKIISDRGITVKHLTQINNTNAICELLQLTDSVAFLPAYSVKQRVEEGNLRLLSTDLPPINYFIKIVSRNNKWIEPYTKDLIQMIISSFPSS